MTAMEGVADLMDYDSEIPKVRERKAVLPFYRSMSNWGALLSLSINPKAMVYFFFL